MTLLITLFICQRAACFAMYAEPRYVPRPSTKACNAAAAEIVADLPKDYVVKNAACIWQKGKLV